MLWFLWPSSLDLGWGWAGGWDVGSCARRLGLVQPPLKKKKSDCLGCCRRNEPEYMVTMYHGETLTLFKLWVLNWLLSSCSTRATFLLFMFHLQESTGLSGIWLLSKAGEKRIIWVDESWRCLNRFLLVPSFSPKKSMMHHTSYPFKVTQNEA